MKKFMIQIRWASFFLFVVINGHLYAQKQSYNWTFGDSCGLRFGAGTPTFQSSIVNARLDIPNGGFHEANAVASNADGHLQCYFLANSAFHQNAEGIVATNFKLSQIINTQHQLMENGDSLFCGYSATNGGLFLPVPGAEKRYYLFTLSQKSDTSLPNGIKGHGLFLHKVDMSANNGLGKVTEKNIMLHDYSLTEKMNAVRHANGRDWWLFTHAYPGKEFVRFLLTPEGIQGPFYQTIGLAAMGIYTVNNGGQMQTHTIYNWASEMLFSPDGTKLINCGSNQNIELFSLDRCTGLLDSVYTHFNVFSSDFFYGAAFSPSGRFLYLSIDAKLHQFDLTEADIWATRKLIFQNAYYENGQLIKLFPGAYFGQLELGPDNKIYLGGGTAYYPASAYWTATNMNLSVIHSPDSAGLACNFQPFSFPLSGRRMHFGLPHFPNFGLGPYAPLEADAGPDKFLCDDKFVTIGTPAASGRTYRWYPATGLADSVAAVTNAKPTVTTSYVLFVSDSSLGACFGGLDTVTVYVNETALSPDFSFTLDGFTASFESNVSDLQNYTIKWNFENGDSSLLAAPFYTFPDTGLFTVTLTVFDTSGCSESVSKTIHVSGPNRTIAPVIKPAVRLYPNPANESLTVEHDFKNATLDLIDANGKVVHSQNALNPKTVIDLRRFARGVYYVRLVTNINQILSVEKVIIH